ncbi:hypothetical protein [Pseudobutyrivibrio ruminis]|uniref:hypothetical protein n=1 Tax=Pseudobutyrivibrio ruminis TaxID=46206 RepID=UPI00041DC384|nr:hypothetical protein [Pseudobutyrivibrio ruminis]
MNISGIRPSTGFYDQNFTRINSDFGLNVKGTAGIGDSVTEDKIYTVDISEDAIQQEARKDQTFGSYDYASQYKPEEHQLKGVDSDISKLDVEKAINDMKKDTAIHRYQYFVHNKNSVDGSFGTTRGTEDFSL